ncbi:hypothetical protein BATDEDRAFT_86311 [Batrachochytrium dendrobatidis JAM81]|uniref:Cation-transporting P-type ATPase N-terminal domain-containing protein n=2 Tax=Batrachochytrium dendrobatidis TaxID=109871 RepID=F4NWL5_BATDJ|nr:uncharacterized protein BATDEDRAFT_86311 [Batrachochytrium dendrobatidis JAM81]EGF82503.1 hypothetical protein BATDEDRAFT_86311 [Batrachochytrium dendrobatidis JAM81]OAJ39505.1 hypothetical protein BDEG_23344 [Batrachochytrium dendrobatidis JEL423]|eukprot:XP_006676948.1 hypothetical protein BATDEDRAFT_86311 [Batrachochytrium dendrobatidis JAM81]
MPNQSNEPANTAVSTNTPAEKQQQVDVNEHLLSLEEVEKKYSVSVDAVKPTLSKGLSPAEAIKRLEQYGPNQLSPPKKRHPFLRFMDHLLGLFNLMLLVSGIAAYILLAINPSANAQNVYVGAILIIVAFMNASIEFYQVQKSQSILESFLNLIPSKCYAIREAKLAQISALELVLGDVVFIKSGDKIPSDLRIFWSNELKVDNSSLTGEAEPQERNANNVMTSPLEATNLVFNGTLVVNGDAYGVVIRTGDNTVIGQIASLTANEQRRSSPLSDEIDTFVKLITLVAGIVAIIFLIIGIVAKGQNASQALNFAIGTFVSFVPEGLPATVTMLLTIAAKRMAGRNVLVKDLQGVETLGAITLLATDKTGTLTRNQMTVTYVWTGSRLFYAQSQSSTEAQHAVPLDMDHAGVNELIHMSLLCSRARFESNDGPIATRPILGDATEAGLLRNGAAKLVDFESVEDRFPKIFEIPFNSENKWAMTIHQKKHANGEMMAYLKGAPERVLRLCTTFFDGTNVVPLTEQHKASFEDMYQFMASKGHRVLAFAALALPGDQYPANFVFTKDPVNYPKNNLTFYGLVSLEDPPKHGVREAVGHCREAGIRVMMVTGDHPLTAEAIGRKINLMLQDTKETLAKKRNVPISQIPESDVNAIVIHGEKIDGLTEADWDNIFSKEEIIFARTSPKHKLQIVKHAQALGHIVGVTGDGVNDSPALKKADLGIAMNVSGSDVSKEAAAMILIDDNFASTVNGIEEGRLIFQNLKKSIQYTVTHTMPEVWANLLYIVVPLPLPLTAIQIIIVDLGFELFLALSYAWDLPESKTGLMKLRPRKPVTPESIARTKRIAARKSEGSAEAQGFAKFTKAISTPFTAVFWHDFMEKRDEETLVDSNLLLWSYLEAGTIMSIGCFVSYFVAFYYYRRILPIDAVNFGNVWGTDSGPITLSSGLVLDNDAQLKTLYYAQSGYYLAIMIQQSFNMFICKARFGIPFGWFMFSNIYNFTGLIGGVIFTMAMVYIPPFNVAFGTNWRFHPILWLIPMAFGIFLVFYAVVRILIQRARNPIKYSKDVDGLQMHPTRWSTGR